jgi:hypothetical protein
MKYNYLRVIITYINILFLDLVDSNPELIECLKEDMDNHINNLKSDYEEKLEIEIRKIKKKYKLK